MPIYPMLPDQPQRKEKGSLCIPLGVSRVAMYSRTESGSRAQAAAPGASAPTFKSQPTASPDPSKPARVSSLPPCGKKKRVS